MSHIIEVNYVDGLDSIQEPEKVTDLTLNTIGITDKDAELLFERAFNDFTRVMHVTLKGYRGFGLLHHLPKRLRSLNVGMISGVSSDSSYLSDDDIDVIKAIEVNSLGLTINEKSHPDTLDLVSKESLEGAIVFFFGETSAVGLMEYNPPPEVKCYRFGFHGKRLMIKTIDSDNVNYELDVTLYKKSVGLIDVESNGVRHEVRFHAKDEVEVGSLSLYSNTKVVGDQDITINNLSYALSDMDNNKDIHGFRVVNSYHSNYGYIPANVDEINDGRVDDYILSWSFLEDNQHAEWIVNNADRVYFEYRSYNLQDVNVSFDIVNKLVEKNNGKFNFYRHDEKTPLSLSEVDQRGDYELPEVLRDVMTYHHLKRVSDAGVDVERKHRAVNKI